MAIAGVYLGKLLAEKRHQHETGWIVTIKHSHSSQKFAATSNSILDFLATKLLSYHATLPYTCAYVRQRHQKVLCYDLDSPAQVINAQFNSTN